MDSPDPSGSVPASLTVDSNVERLAESGVLVEIKDDLRRLLGLCPRVDLLLKTMSSMEGSIRAQRAQMEEVWHLMATTRGNKKQHKEPRNPRKPVTGDDLPQKNSTVGSLDSLQEGDEDGAEIPGLVTHVRSSPASSAQPSERKEGVPALQLRPPRQRPRVSTEKRRVSSDLNLGHQLHSKSVSIESCDEPLCDRSIRGKMDELEQRTAQHLQRKFRKAVIKKDENVEEEARDMADAGTKRSKSDKVTRLRSVTLQKQVNGQLTGDEKREIMKKCRKLSLDDLRYNCDAVVVRASIDETNSGVHNIKSPQSTKTRLNDDDVPSAMSCIGRFLLATLGLVDVGSSRAWGALAVANMFLPAAALIPLVHVALEIDADPFVWISGSCLAVGVVLATCNLRLCGIHSVLGPRERSLDTYAFNADFLPEWRRESRSRLVEVALVFAVSAAVRLTYIWMAGTWHTYDLGDAPVSSCLFLEAVAGLFALRFAILAYAQMHVCMGLELAIDGFAFRFFKEMDVASAAEEWNTVQATLRQVSWKISGSIVFLGLSFLGMLIPLAERAYLQPELLHRCLEALTWAYAPILLHMYVMMRAATVSEKASRLAPLVNSWKFEPDDEEDDVEESWMDHDRQYMVQYIVQSQAGFYIRGVRLTALAVQKMSYYLLAFTFALVSRLA